jgi:hypothetical protein
LDNTKRTGSVITFSKGLLLFTLNWLDAQLTILWIRLQVATEGNRLMASLLDLGETPFLMVKLTIGAFATVVLYRCAHLQLAQRGMHAVLMVYLMLMFVHAATGFATLGWEAPATVLAYFAGLPKSILAFFS